MSICNISSNPRFMKIDSCKRFFDSILLIFEVIRPADLKTADSVAPKHISKTQDLVEQNNLINSNY